MDPHEEQPRDRITGTAEDARASANGQASEPVRIEADVKQHHNMGALVGTVEDLRGTLRHGVKGPRASIADVSGAVADANQKFNDDLRRSTVNTFGGLKDALEAADQDVGDGDVDVTALELLSVKQSSLRDPLSPKNFRAEHRGFRIKSEPRFSMVVGVETRTNRLVELAKKHEHHPVVKTMASMHRMGQNNQFTTKAAEIMDNKRFEQFIIASILVSSLILAFDNMPALFEVVCDYIFTIIFTFEAAVKITAMGYKYFRDSWNLMDIFIVIEGLASLVQSYNVNGNEGASRGGGNLKVIRTIRVLRPLRTAHHVPSVKMIVEAILSALPAIWSVLFVFGLFLVVSSIITTAVWQHKFHYRCTTVEDHLKDYSNGTKDLIDLFDLNVDHYEHPELDHSILCMHEYAYKPNRGHEAICHTQVLSILSQGYDCGHGDNDFCVNVKQSPKGGWISFDTIWASLFTLFIVTTLEDWQAVCYQTQQVTGEHSVWIFVILIVIGSGVLMNLLVAALLMELHNAMEGTETGDNAPEVFSFKKALLRFLKRKGVHERFRGVHGTPFKNWLRSSVTNEKSRFNMFFNALIAFNILVMCGYYYDSPYNDLLDMINSVCSVLFNFEFAWKIVMIGPLQYFFSPYDCIDFFIVSVSNFELIMAGTSGVAELRMLKVLRVLRTAKMMRLAKNSPSVRKVTNAIFESLGGLWPVAVLGCLCLFIFSVLGKELFGDLEAFTGESYLRFDTFAWSTLQCFLVIIGEDWSRIMYFVMIEVGGWASFYFLAEVLIGRMIVLNLVLAVVLSNDSVGVTMRDDKMRMYLVSVYEKIMTRAAFKRWKHGRHDPHLYETLEMIQAQEEGTARPRILNSKIYGNSLKELDGTRKRRNNWLKALHEIHQEHMSLDELALEAENNPHIKLSKRKRRAIIMSQERYHKMHPEHQGTHLSLSVQSEPERSWVGANSTDDTKLQAITRNLVRANSVHGAATFAKQEKANTQNDDSGDQSPPDSPAVPGYGVWHDHGNGITSPQNARVEGESADGSNSRSGVLVVPAPVENGGDDVGPSHSSNDDDSSSILAVPASGMRPGWSKFRSGSQGPPGTPNGTTTGGVQGPNSEVKEEHHFLDIQKPKDFHLKLGGSHADSEQWADSQRSVSLRAHQNVPKPTHHTLLSSPASPLASWGISSRSKSSESEPAASAKSKPEDSDRPKASPKGGLGPAQRTHKTSAWDSALIGSTKSGEAAVGLRAEMVASKMIVRERRALHIRDSIKQVDEDGNETLKRGLGISSPDAIAALAPRKFSDGNLHWLEFEAKFFLRKENVIWHRFMIMLILLDLFIDLTEGRDGHDNHCHDMKDWRNWVRIFCDVVFCIEIVINTLALGVWSMLTRGYKRLDLSVTTASILSLVICNDHRTAAKVIGICRSMRPLRIISRIPTLHQSLIALVISIRSITTLFLFMLFMMVAWSLVGMQLFSGALWHCTDPDFEEGASRYGEMRHGEWTQVPCESYWDNGTWVEREYRWANPTFNFDNIFNSLLSVLVISVEGWGDIMKQAMSAPDEVDHQGVQFNSSGASIYFIIGNIFFGLYLMNLFTGVVFDSFLMLKSTSIAGEILSPEERRWNEYEQRLSQCRPHPIKKAEYEAEPIRYICWKMQRTSAFRTIVTILVLVNALCMAVIPSTKQTAVIVTNAFFAVVFLLEMLIKIKGLTIQGYLDHHENIFDAFVVVIGIVDAIVPLLDTWIPKACHSSEFLTLIRATRCFRLLRLTSVISQAQLALDAMTAAFGHFFKVSVLIGFGLLIMGEIGMVIFDSRKFEGVFDQDGFNLYANFETRYGMTQIMFIIATGDGWSSFMLAALDRCDTLFESAVIVLYFTVLALGLAFFMVNLFVGIVSDAYAVLADIVRIRIERILPRFKEVWLDFDPNGTGSLLSEPMKEGETPQRRLEKLLRRLPKPLGFDQSASFQLVQAKASLLVAQSGFSYHFNEILIGLSAVWLHNLGIKSGEGDDYVELFRQEFAVIKIEHGLRNYIARFRARKAAMKAGLPPPSFGGGPFGISNASLSYGTSSRHGVRRGSSSATVDVGDVAQVKHFAHKLKENASEQVALRHQVGAMEGMEGIGLTPNTSTLKPTAKPFQMTLELSQMQDVTGEEGKRHPSWFGGKKTPAVRKRVRGRDGAGDGEIEDVGSSGGTKSEGVRNNSEQIGGAEPRGNERSSHGARSGGDLRRPTPASFFGYMDRFTGRPTNDDGRVLPVVPAPF